MKILDTISITISELDKKVNRRYTGKVAFIYNMNQGGIGNLQVIDLKGEDERIYCGEKEIKKIK